MNELEMCKAFAELEGFSAKIRRFKSSAYECGYHAHVYLKGNPNGAGFWDNVYNPITDQCLTFQAAIDYEVFIDHRDERLFILNALSEETSVDFKEGGIPKAIIECILKSKGLYLSS